MTLPDEGHGLGREQRRSVAGHGMDHPLGRIDNGTAPAQLPAFTHEGTAGHSVSEKGVEKFNIGGSRWTFRYQRRCNAINHLA